MGIPVTLLVIFDSIYIKSVFGVILQSAVLICSTVGYFSNKKEEQKIYLLTEMNA